MEISTRNPLWQEIAVFSTTLLTCAAIRHCYEPVPIAFVANKRNFLNVYFVKQAWGWTSLASLLILGGHYFLWKNSKRSSSNKLVFFIFRWIGATLYWFVLNQSFFGPSILDRVYVATGGSCLPGDEQITAASMDHFAQINSYAVCRTNKGIWSGGHDVSGHAMLLTHSSLYLLREMWYLYGRRRKSVPLVHFDYVVQYFVYGMVGLWWGMLALTGLFFHPFWEKLNGLVLGIAYCTLVYGWMLGKPKPLKSE